MYFIVFLSKLQRNVVLPSSWIKDVDEHYEKFMNYSVNSSQKFLCYYTTKETAFNNGKPKENFPPDFNSNMVSEINADGSFDGCFIGKIKKCKCKFFFR